MNPNPPSPTKLSLYAQLVNQHLDRNEFNKIVKRHHADKYCKKFDSWSQLVWMIFCHLSSCSSIRDISNVMHSITGNINHLGLSRAPSKSSVAYQNKNRTWEIFKDYYYTLLARLGQQQRARKYLKNMEAGIKLLDSSTVTLSLSAFPWACYTHEKGAIKLHTKLDMDKKIPEYLHITDGKTTDSKAAFQLPVSKGEIIVADRGYQDFNLLRFWDSNKAFFVIRHRQDLQFDSRAEFDLPEGSHQEILKDEIIFLSYKGSAEKYPKELRRVVIYVEGKQHAIELLTNNFEWDANVISALYKDRWYIESFFKTVKQLLHIKTFLGTSLNAVFSQIWTAMIAILLLYYLKRKAHYPWHMSNLVAFLRINLFVKIDLWTWLNKPFHPPREDSLTLKQGGLF